MKLTDLGHRLVDPQTQKVARVNAFMVVPLYAAVYNEYEGRNLPPDKGLERKIADLGVSEKQTAKARQSLKSSARLAGFFATDPSRLIQPHGSQDPGGGDQTNNNGEEETKIVQQPNAGTVPLPDLWLTLLNEGDTWSADKTQDFVNAARKLREVMARDS